MAQQASLKANYPKKVIRIAWIFSFVVHIACVRLEVDMHYAKRITQARCQSVTTLGGV